jgi:hypothetical protein
MNEHGKRMNVERLFQAAEAVMSALSGAKNKGPRSSTLPDLVGKLAAPKAMLGFSQGEVVEATMFLARLGYVEVSPR